jgi:anti-sigma factor RsiW
MQGMSASEDEMTCKELVEVVTDYVEGVLPADDRMRLEAHLRDCPACVTYVEQIRTTIESAGRLRPESLPASMQRELLEAFRGWRDGVRNARPPRGTTGP